MFINQNCLSSQPYLTAPTLHVEVPSHPEFSADYFIELHFTFHVIYKYFSEKAMY